MRRVLLAIDLADLMMTAQADQGRQGNFGRIGLAVKHRLAKHRLSHGNAIQATDQFTFDPGFDAVGPTRMVQVGIGVDHGGHDPGALRTLSGAGRAGLNDLCKGAVNADLAVWITGKFFQGFFQ